MGRTAGIWPYVSLAPALAVFFLLEIVPAFATSIFSLTDYTGLPGAPIQAAAVSMTEYQTNADLLTELRQGSGSSGRRGGLGEAMFRSHDRR